METAIRWNQRSTPSDPSFLVVDVIGRTFKHCRVLSSTKNNLQWQEISRNSRVPAFRAFDWNFLHNVVAIGQWSGEANVLRLDNESEALSLPIKSQRQCNAVAFNPETLLATGLERVRNDFCLNVYDVVHWSAPKGSHSLLPQQPPHEPIRKLATSEGITSIKFFQEEPNVLVAGVKGTCVRVYDLRESSGNPAIQYNTTCVHNVAVDPCNANYFASAGPVKDCTAQIWDRRSASRQPTTAPPSAMHFSVPDTPVLELKEVFRSGGETESPSIWSLRYSIIEPGTLGVLGSSGSVRIFETKRSYSESETQQTRDDPGHDPTQDIYVNRTEIFGAPLHHPGRGSKSSSHASTERVLAFDFINVLSCNQRSSAITFFETQEIGIREVNLPLPTLRTSWKNSVALYRASKKSRSRRGKSLPPGLSVHQARRQGRIAEIRRAVNAKLEALDTSSHPASPTTPSRDGWSAVDEDINDGWIEDPPSTQSSPIKAEARDGLSLLARRAPYLTVREALILADTSRRRCKEGYLFNADKNTDIVREENELRWMWDWIKVARENGSDDKLVMNGVDFGYYGVQSIWDSRLGPDSSARIRRPSLNMDVPKIIINLVHSLNLPEIELPRSAKTYQRRLSLFVLGFDPTSDVLLPRVKSLALAGHNSEAALHALLAGEASLAATALRSGPRHSQNKALSLLLSLYSNKSERAALLPQITSIGATEKDPFSLGILSLLTSQTTTAPPSLPPAYQLGLALKSLPDPALRSYLSNTLSKATASGNAAYLPLTGITNLSVRLFESYLARTSDLQSVILALSHASPLYFHDPRIDAWRAEYRALLNKYGLHIKRAQFDMQATKLATAWNGRMTLEPARRQVTLKCANCDGPLHREQEDQKTQRGKPLPQAGHSKTPSQTIVHHPPTLTSAPSDMSTFSTSTLPPGALSVENSFGSTISTSTSTAPDSSLPTGTSLPGPLSAPLQPPSPRTVQGVPLPLPQPLQQPYSPTSATATAMSDTILPTLSTATGPPPATAAPASVPPAAAEGGVGDNVPTAPPPQPQPRIFGGPRDGTMCPHCGARLPRCAVCDLWVGETDPRSRGARAKVKARRERREERAARKKGDGEELEDGDRFGDGGGEEDALEGGKSRNGDRRGNAEAEGHGRGAGEGEGGRDEGEEESNNGSGEEEGKDGDEAEDPMHGFVEICLGCRHVYHRRHAREWFGRHAECAAVGCRCPCGALDGSFSGRRRRRV